MPEDPWRIVITSIHCSKAKKAIIISHRVPVRRTVLHVVPMKSAFPTIKMTLCNASAMMASKEHLAVRKRNI